MQASYLPTGALGDVKVIRNQDLGLYNKDSAAQPQTYGAEAALYMQLKYDANKKIVPLTSDALFWTIEANGAFGIPADAVNSPERFYFTLPTFEQQGYGPELEKAADVSKHPVLGQFPALHRNSGAATPNASSSPRIINSVVKVTRGNTSTPWPQPWPAGASELTRLTEANRGRPEESRGGEDRRCQHGEAGCRAGREPAEVLGTVQETAEIHSDQPSVIIENETDVFEGSGGSTKRLIVYAIDPKMMELSKTDAPQWILISWTAHLNDPISLSLHQAMLNNVNVQYIYDYFFDPDKVKGQPYQPLRSPAAVDVVTAGRPPKRRRKLQTCRALLRGLLVRDRRQEAAQLEQHARQHRHLERRDDGQRIERPVGDDGRHADHAHRAEDTAAA
jgi:hypothetical protein